MVSRRHLGLEKGQGQKGYTASCWYQRRGSNGLTGLSATEVPARARVPGMRAGGERESWLPGTPLHELRPWMPRARFVSSFRKP